MLDRHAIIHYLRACYEADNRETTLFNLKSDRVQHLEFLSKGGDFLRGALDVVPVDREKALAAQKTAELYETERSLIFGAVMVEGRAKSFRGETAVFAPLLMFPAVVEPRGDYATLKVDYNQQRETRR